MTKQVIAALGVLIILIVSQMIWFNQVWEMDKQRLKDELNSEISNIVNFQSLSLSTIKDKDNKNICPMTIKDGGQTQENEVLTTNSITTDSYSSDKSLGKMVEDAFMDLALQANQIKVSYIDSIFRKSYPHIKEVSYYSLKLYKNSISIDSISYGRSSLSSPFTINIPLGSKKTYHIKADFVLKSSVQVRNILFSIGVTAFAVIIVAFFIIFQIFQLRKKAQQLQLREKTVSGIVHDLKSPLSYIYMMLGFFESSEKDIVKQQSLYTAKTRVKILSEKIELLLSTVKASKSRLVMNKVSYNIPERCTEIFEELKLIYKDKKIDYKILMPVDFTVNADKTYFEGCIRNLLDNAIKYSPENTEITVSSEIKSNRTFLYFKDNGSGIPKELQKKVFKEFYRNTDYGNIKGHGVGLSFTKQIVEAHNGKIYIKNEDGNQAKGTTFVVELPIS